MGDVSTPYRHLLGRPQDKSIPRILNVTPCILVNILRAVTSKNVATFITTVVTNTSLTERQIHWRNLSLKLKIKFAVYLVIRLRNI